MTTAITDKKKDYYVHVHATSVKHQNNDSIVVCEKNTETGENRLNIITNPPRKFWVTRPALQNHNVKKEYEVLENLDCYTTTSNGLPFDLARALGVKPQGWNPLRKLCDSPYVYGADISQEVLVKLQYKYAHDKYPSGYGCGALDIETSVLGGKEINVITFIDANHKVYCGVLKEFCKIPEEQIKAEIEGKVTKAMSTAIEEVTEKYATIMYDAEKLLASVPRNARDDATRYASDAEIGAVVLEKINEFHTKLDAKYKQSLEDKPFDITLKVCEKESTLIGWIFKMIHEHKTEFIGIWNMGFDIPYIMQRIEYLGGECKDVMCHPDVPKHIRKAEWRPDPKKQLAHFTERWDWFDLTGYTQFIDSMCLYSRMRHAKGKDISYTLEYIANKEIGIGKLKLGSDNHYTMQTKHFTEYVAYNIVDCILLVLMEEKNTDIANLIRLADISPLRDFNKQTTQIKNTFYEYCILRNRVPGAVGSTMEMEYDKMIQSTGGNVLPATLAQNTGISVLTEYEGSTQLHRGVCDLDVQSEYPSIDIVFGTFKETKISTCLQIQGKPGKESIEDFFGNITSPIENSVHVCKEFFNLPGYGKMLELFDKNYTEPEVR